MPLLRLGSCWHRASFLFQRPNYVGIGSRRRESDMLKARSHIGTQAADRNTREVDPILRSVNSATHKRTLGRHRTSMLARLPQACSIVRCYAEGIPDSFAAIHISLALSEPPNADHHPGPLSGDLRRRVLKPMPITRYCICRASNRSGLPGKPSARPRSSEPKVRPSRS